MRQLSAENVACRQERAPNDRDGGDSDDYGQRPQPKSDQQANRQQWGAIGDAAKRTDAGAFQAPVPEEKRPTRRTEAECSQCKTFAR